MSSSPPLIVSLGYSSRANYTVDQSYRLQCYDFRLDPIDLCFDAVNMNSFWLCCGRDPKRRMQGAWLLAPGDRVLAYLPRSEHVNFNAKEGRHYLRLYFVNDQGTPGSAKIDVRDLPPLKVRVALLPPDSEGDEMYLMACGEGDAFDITPRDFNDELIARIRWLNGPTEGFMSRDRWRPPAAPKQSLSFKNHFPATAAAAGATQSPSGRSNSNDGGAQQQRLTNKYGRKAVHYRDGSGQPLRYPPDGTAHLYATDAPYDPCAASYM